MVDLARILSSPDITTLREAVAAAFEELSQEQANSLKIADIEARLKGVEENLEVNELRD